MAKHEFKAGDRVQFKEWEEMVKEFGKDSSCSDIKLSVPSPFFSAGMKHLCGTYATLKDFTIGGRVHLSDMTAKGDIGWSYHVDMLKPASTKKQKVDEPKKSPEPVYPPIVTAHIYPTITAHTIEGNKTTVMLSDGRMGEATCYYKDTFDPAVGLAEAYKKALGIATKSDKPKVVEVKRQAKNGEYIKVVDTKRYYDTRFFVGDILKCTDECTDNTTWRGVGIGYVNITHPEKNNNNLVICNTDYVVLENYFPVEKKAEDKPQPKFEVGKKYVFGTNLPNVIGDIIEITSCEPRNNTYFYKYEVIKTSKPHMHNLLWFYEKSERGNSLTPYTEPKVKEVKRTAKVGEWIKITNPTDGHYPEVNKGDILKVDQIIDVYVGTTSGNGFRHSEYVVLEGYNPAK